MSVVLREGKGTNFNVSVIGWTPLNVNAIMLAIT